jgi:hypothetical protein
MTKPSYPQAHESTVGSKKMPGANTSSKHYNQLCKSDDVFLDNSITHAKDEHTAIAKNNTNNSKHVSIDSAHAQCDQKTIRIAHRSQNTAYCLGSIFN